MAAIKFFRETAVPSDIAPYAVYFVAPPDKADYVEVYVSNADGTKMRRAINERDVQALINAALASSSNIQVVDNIGERDAFVPDVTTWVYVKDASADPTVQTGGATYLWDARGKAWVKTSEAESLDVQLTWAAIQGAPNSSPTQIDRAVAQAHTHANNTQLDKINEDTDGNLTYGGKPVATAWSTTGW